MAAKILQSTKLKLATLLGFVPSLRDISEIRGLINQKTEQMQRYQEGDPDRLKYERRLNTLKGRLKIAQAKRFQYKSRPLYEEWSKKAEPVLAELFRANPALLEKTGLYHNFITKVGVQDFLVTENVKSEGNNYYIVSNPDLGILNSHGNNSYSLGEIANQWAKDLLSGYFSPNPSMVVHGTGRRDLVKVIKENSGIDLKEAVRNRTFK